MHIHQPPCTIVVRRAANPTRLLTLFGFSIHILMRFSRDQCRLDVDLTSWNVNFYGFFNHIIFRLFRSLSPLYPLLFLKKRNNAMIKLKNIAIRFMCLLLGRSIQILLAICYSYENYNLEHENIKFKIILVAHACCIREDNDQPRKLTCT